MKIHRKYNDDVVTNGNKLLKRSCQKAVERSRSNIGVYKNVKCSFKTANKFYLSIRSNKKLYHNWLEQTAIYLQEGKDLSFRPTIDRIDPSGHYFIYNIQVLSYGKNASKARKRK